MVTSCIYKIQSTSNKEKVYIGSAVNFRKRKNIHLHQLRNNRHHSKKLQRHYNKYGENDLEFIILNECDPSKLIIREQCYLNIYKPYFNSVLNASSPLGFRHSDESLEKMRKKHNITKETHEIMSSNARNRKISDETRKKLSISNSGKKQSTDTINKRIESFKKTIQKNGGGWAKGIKRSDEFKEKLRVANLGKKHSVETRIKISESKKKLFALKRQDNDTE